MNKKIRIIALTAIILVIAIIGAVFILGKGKDPRAAVLEAAANTLGAVEPTADALYALYKDITATGQMYAQDISLGINGLDANAFAGADPRILSGLEMLAIRDTVHYHPAGKKRFDDITVNFAVTPLARLQLYTDPAAMSLSAPQAFDYAVSIDPAHVAQEWDGSILGTYLGNIEGIILEDMFYEYYMRLLFPETAPARAKLFDFAQYGAILDAGAEYINAENVYNEESEVEYRSYAVKITPEALNNTKAALLTDFPVERFPDDYYGRTVNGLLDEMDSFAFTEGVELTVRILDERIVYISINGTPFQMTVDPDATSGEVRWEDASAFNWRIHDMNNITVEMQSEYVDINGSLLANPESKTMDIRLDNIDIKGVASLTLGLTLRPGNEVISVPGGRPLSSINELDVLAMYAKIQADPDIGPLISEYLP